MCGISRVVETMVVVVVVVVVVDGRTKWRNFGGGWKRKVMGWVGAE